MTKNKEFTEVLGILEDVYGWNDTNELTEMQSELVNDVISVVKKLTIPVVVGQSEQLCDHKIYHKNGMIERYNNFCEKCNTHLR